MSVTGRRIEALGMALGMQLLIAERKGASETRPGRVPFSQCLSLGTLLSRQRRSTRTPEA
jgi:glycerate dehydrogenase